MAFESKDLSVLAYANGFTLWHYTTTDADAAAAGYFDNAAEMLRAGDVIIANVGTAGERRLGVLHVAASGDEAVAVDNAA